jgi:hypothetical protein
MSDTHSLGHGETHDTHGSDDSHTAATESMHPDTSHDTAAPTNTDESLHLSKLAHAIVEAFEKKQSPPNERHISVNPVVSKFASWYEKLRNAMEYREDEVILRATIERILHRRLLLGGNAKTTALPLIRELIWARYLGDETVGESMVGKVEEVIDLYLQLRLNILHIHKFSDRVLNQWTYDLMSSHIEQVIKPNRENDLIATLLFQLLKDNVEIVDDTEETRDAQVYLAVRKAFARDDRAFLRFHMFGQIFGMLQKDNVADIATSFPKGFAEINKQLDYPRKDVIYSYIKKQTAPFLILEDIFHEHKNDLSTFITGSGFKNAVYKTCERRYQSISRKVTTAIIRSFIFILFTKLIFAFAVEGTYERIVYGAIQWRSIAINTGIPPLLMVIVGFMIQTPDQSNTDRIYAYLKRILSEEKPKLGQSLRIKKERETNNTMDTVFMITWMLAFFLSFGGIIYVLYLVQFHAVSMGIFIFFLAIVSFLAYRISVTASLYRLGEKQGLLTPVVDFFLLPIIRVGRQLTEGISQVNFIIFLFDFVIETPFKELFAFFEQLFYFLHTKRDELG